MCYKYTNTPTCVGILIYIFKKKTSCVLFILYTHTRAHTTEKVCIPSPWFTCTHTMVFILDGTSERVAQLWGKVGFVLYLKFLLVNLSKCISRKITYLNLQLLTQFWVTTCYICHDIHTFTHVSFALLYVQEVVTYLENIGSNYSCNLIHVT